MNMKKKLLISVLALCLPLLLIGCTVTYSKINGLNPNDNSIRVVFATNGGESVTPLDLTVDSFSTESFSAALPKTEREGYIFEGWYLDDESFEDPADSITFEKLSNYMVLYAKWLKISSLYIDAQGYPGEVTVNGEGPFAQDESIDISCTSVYGYDFIGWYIGDTCISTEMNFVYRMPDKDVKISLVWRVSEFTIETKSETEGFVAIKGNYDYKTNLTLTANDIAHHEFIGWYMDGEQVGTEQSLSITVEDNAVYEAKYCPLYTVEVLSSDESMGSASGGAADVHAGTAVALSAEAFYGYDFIGWYAEDSFLSSEKDYTYTVGEGNAVITARFASHEFEIKTISETEGFIATTGVYPYRTRLTLTANTIDHYSFISWYLNGEQVGETPSLEITVEKDATYTANYEPLYTVTVNSFDEEMGTARGGAEDVPDGTVVAVTASALYGYDFIGWYYGDTLLSESAEYNYTIDGRNATLTAHFAVHAFTIESFSETEGFAATRGNYGYKTKLTLTANEIEHYTFAGWYLDGEKVGTDLSLEITVEKDDRYEAVYKSLYTVTVASSNETMGKASGGAEDMPAGAQVSMSATANYGYDFIGWYDGDTLLSESAKYTYTVDRRSVTLIANFKPHKFSINTYSAHEGYAQEENSGKFDYLTNLTLTANKIDNAAFIGWYQNGTCVNKKAAYTFTVTKDLELEARYFDIIDFVLIKLPEAGKSLPGEKLVNVPLNGGETNIPGYFVWRNPDATVEIGGRYFVLFIPDEAFVDYYDEAEYIIEVPLLTEVLATPKISLSGDMLTWKAVEGAVGYTVKINDNEYSVPATMG